ncbi:MAG: glycosyltransferase [Nakamurella sp.]
MTPYAPSAPPRLQVSVCIVLFHTDEYLVEECLSSVERAATYAGCEAEIIVVDNSSDAGLRGIFGTRARKWIWTPENLGFGTAANRACAVAEGTSMLLLNPDARLDETALLHLRNARESFGDEDVLLGGWLHHGDRVQIDAFLFWWTSLGRFLKRPQFAVQLAAAADSALMSVEKVCGGALFGDTALLRGLGPFDERFFMYGEDADLSVRAANAGVKLFVVPPARVEHAAASSQQQFSALVERARADAAIRMSSYHRSRIAALAVRFDLLVVTIIGLLPGLGKTSGSKPARIGRLCELGRWRLARDRPQLRP